MSDETTEAENRLFKPCDACNGRGRWRGYYGGERCYNCNGMGILFTEDGALIARMVRMMLDNDQANREDDEENQRNGD